jgi:hypothetical protein
MPDIENTVDVTLPEAVDDAQQNDGESLNAITEENQEEQPKQDAGWFRQRIDKAVSKAVAEAEARMAAKYEAQLAEFANERIQRQAQELVDSGKITDLETAVEYLTMKNGRQPKEQPKQEVDPAIQAKADVLAAQAHKIKSSSGIDVMAAYNDDAEIQQKVASGEWDFYDVRDFLQSKRNPPSPARSSNGAHTEKASIKNMSESQWKALQKNLDQGKRYNLRD